jgi:threonine aldolase
LDIGAQNVLVRLVTSFATSEEDIERFVKLCESFEERPAKARPRVAPI